MEFRVKHLPVKATANGGTLINWLRDAEYPNCNSGLSRLQLVLQIKEDEVIAHTVDDWYMNIEHYIKIKSGWSTAYVAGQAATRSDDSLVGWKYAKLYIIAPDMKSEAELIRTCGLFKAASTSANEKCSKASSAIGRSLASRALSILSAMIVNTLIIKQI